MPWRQESDSPFPRFQSRSHWLHGGQGGGVGRAGDWKSNPRRAGLPGDDSRHLLIIDNRRPFLTSWRHSLLPGPELQPSRPLWGAGDSERESRAGQSSQCRTRI